MDLAPGLLLLSDPFLKDPNFSRAVILLCEHNESGSFGLVINKQIQYTLGDLVQQATGIDFPLFEGGPVQQNAVHFIHRSPDKIPDGVAIGSGMFWGGNFEEALEQIRLGKINKNEIRFFVGYSGWSEGQLQEEYNEKSWILSNTHTDIVFDSSTSSVWKKVMQGLGGEYALMVNYPSDPQLN